MSNRAIFSVPLWQLIRKKLSVMSTGDYAQGLARMNFGPIIRGITRRLFTRVQSAILSNGTVFAFCGITWGA